MAKPTRAELLSRVYHDPKNYPYEFFRSGDFSISEAKALAAYGVLISALVDGHATPETDEDKEFISVTLREKEPSTVAEKAWAKYVKRINRQRTGSIYGKGSAQTDDDDDSMDDVDLDTGSDTYIQIEESEE